MIKFGSLFSGVGGFDLGFERAGMKSIWQCEIDKHCQEVLKEHFKGVKIYDDVRTITKTDAVDLICGGFPCQDLSVAGKRKGLSGERSGLWFEFARVIDELEPKWVVIENVPGLLSSNKGRDFAVVIRWLANRGYGVSWRILDSQYFGVAQRRRRVFIVASFGNGSCAEVLFESDGMSGNTAKGKQEGEETAKTFTVRTGKEGGGKGYLEADGAMTLGGQPQWLFDRQRSDEYGESEVASTISRVAYKGSTDLIGFTQAATPDITGDKANTLDSGNSARQSICQALQARDYKGVGNQYVAENKLVCWQDRQRSDEMRIQGDTTPTLTRGKDIPLVGVRRLTPTECERLQGFPDGWTKSQSDSQRYKQMGNAVTVNVIEWIGKRIVEQDNHGS
jgi:DNA (cytosine-5)-methyltransferase 1